MSRKKKEKVHCPAPDCQGGYSKRLYEVNEKVIEKIPTDILFRIEREKPVFRCSYCGFVWGKKISKADGIDIVPLGFYDNSQHPNVFLPVSENYKTR